MTEARLQALMADWLACTLPDAAIFHHSPNEGLRHVAFRVKLRNMGFKSGWPDIEIFAPRGCFHDPAHWAPIFLEVKAATGKVSKAQKEVLEGLEGCGCHVGIVRSIGELESFLAELLELDVSMAKLHIIRELEGAMNGGS